MENIQNQELSDDDFNDSKFLLSLLKGVREVYILWLISKKKIHGYGIVSQLNIMSKAIDENKVVHTSAIYPILYSLEEEGLITSSEQLKNNHKVKIYEITSQGIVKLNNIKKCIKQAMTVI